MFHSRRTPSLSRVPASRWSRAFDFGTASGPDRPCRPPGVAVDFGIPFEWSRQVYRLVERGGEGQRLDRTEEHFLRSIVDGKTAFPEDIQTHNPIHLVADGLLKEREVFRQNRKRLGIEPGQEVRKAGRRGVSGHSCSTGSLCRVVRPAQDCVRFSGRRHLGRPQCPPGNLASGHCQLILQR